MQHIVGLHRSILIDCGKGKMNTAGLQQKSTQNLNKSIDKSYCGTENEAQLQLVQLMI